jgi:hypothetical protein
MPYMARSSSPVIRSFLDSNGLRRQQKIGKSSPPIAGSQVPPARVHIIPPILARVYRSMVPESQICGSLRAVCYAVVYPEGSREEHGDGHLSVAGMRHSAGHTV